MADNEVRQRQRKAAEAPVVDVKPLDAEKKKKKAKKDVDDEGTNWTLDILRVLTFGFAVSLALSHLVSGGESLFWNLKNKPNFFRMEWWKIQMSQMSGPIYLTPEELATYDGSDPEKPLYLAINHTIYDVSNGRHIYGPGGSYQYFGGCDAARAYVTGCFADDRTPDMRGVEEMYLPLDDPETDAHWTAAELAELKQKEQKAAEERTFNALKHWVDFFANSQKYHFVGYVKRDDDWLEKTPKRELCDRARKGRKKRKIPKDDL